MTPILPNIRFMTYQEADKAGLHSRGLILEYEDRSYRLSAGTSDQIHVFTRSIYLFVLSISRSLGYIGFEAYAPLEEEPINGIYLHSEHHIRELLGKNWNLMNPETVATRLFQYLM
jgi:hypothetical protein